MSFGETRDKHTTMLVGWAGFVRRDIQACRAALEADDCGFAAKLLRNGWRHWGRAKAHEDSISRRRGRTQLPARARTALDQERWEAARRDLEDLEREVSIECERTSRARIVP